MEDISAAQALADFVQRHSGVIIESTSATVVICVDDLYNVVGSTPDPKINGLTWKQLLISNGIGTNANDHCYATSPLPDPGETTTHPQFKVGGHMTTDDKGNVPTGGTCYLMPLCSWHNSTSKNFIPFTHSPDAMLELNGYMQGEMAATFLARMPSAAPYTMVGVHGSQVFTADVAQPDIASLFSGQTDVATGKPFPEHYILFKQIQDGGKIRYVIEDSRVPEAVTG